MSETFGSYKRVLFIGIDGMGVFNAKTPTPNMDKLFENGAVTYSALASRPSISAQCWTSMLTGAIPEVHKLTNGNMNHIPELPTVLQTVKELYSDSDVAAFTQWEPIAKNIISEKAGLSKLVGGGTDEEICSQTVYYISNHDPKLLYVYFGSVDSYGHKYGYQSKKYLQRITETDGFIGLIIEKYKEKNLLDDTLVMVTTDHGGTAGGSHGDWSDDERIVFLGVAGRNVKKGTIGPACLRDYPAIIFHALGIKAPNFDPNGYAAQMPVGIFEDAGVMNRVALYPEYKAYDRIKEQPQKDTPEYLGNFLDIEKVKFWQTFEEGILDVTENCTVSETGGLVKTYNNGFVGKCGEYGNGSLLVEGCKTSKRFTIAFWCCNSGDSRWLELISNCDGVHKGFSASIYAESVGLHLKEPDGYQPHYSEIFVKTYESASSNIWTHYMYEIDTVNNVVTGFVNFEKVDVYQSDFDLKPYFDVSTFKMSAAQHNNEIFYKVVDDVMIIDGKAPSEELKKYYNI